MYQIVYIITLWHKVNSRYLLSSRDGNIIKALRRQAES